VDVVAAATNSRPVALPLRMAFVTLLALRLSWLEPLKYNTNVSQFRCHVFQTRSRSHSYVSLRQVRNVY
jgi:hypothetical protein